LFFQSASWLKQLVAQPSTSVLQVKMDGAQQGMLSKATTLLNEATGGKYVVVLSSNAPPAADTHAHRLFFSISFIPPLLPLL
jgi:hypothetical protein